MARPVPLEASPLPSSSLKARVRRALLATWRGRVLLGALAVGLLDGLLSCFGGGAPGVLRVLAKLVLGAYALWGLWVLLRWLSVRVLWRIRTKLLLSYLFVAVVPVVLLSLFLGIGAFLLLGLVASHMVTRHIEHQGEILQTSARDALAGLPLDARAGAAVRDRLAPTRSRYPGLSWTLTRAGHVIAASGASPQTLPPWWQGPGFAGLVAGGQREEGPAPDVLRAAWAEGGAALVLDVPVGADFFKDLEDRTGAHVILPGALKSAEVGGATGASPGRGGVDRDIVPEGQPTRTSLTFVTFPARTDWETGKTSAFGGLSLPFQFQPLELVRRLSPGLLPREAEARTLPDVLIFGMGIVGLTFLVMYGVALMLGVMLARSITRGVHELSLGTQRLRQGDFTHTIRIRSRDQLGDLAESFNLMSRGIRDLMREHAEKERLEEELRIAREIQMSLLPSGTLSTLPGMRVAALCIPAAEVGGDYYDVLALSDTRMGVLVADVSGKGTSAALYMAELKGLVLSLSRVHDSPGPLLVEANRILAESMDSRTFVTMTYAVVDIDKRRMCFARAGHSPLIHLEARSGVTRVLAPPGLGLGLEPGEGFARILEEEEVPLVPGDFFLFFTDGLSEAMNEGAELFGEGRLRRILEQSAELTSEQLRARILEEVERFVGGAAPHDDLTMVVLKVVPEEPAR